MLMNQGPVLGSGAVAQNGWNWGA